jgi:AraC family ethanolamine operon transcriptional activator
MDAVSHHHLGLHGRAPLWGGLPSPRASLRTTEAHDADEHAHNLTAWDQRYDQLSAGRFTGQLTELRLPQMQVFREGTSQALRQSCRVWADSFWFGLPDVGPSSPLPGTAEGAPTRINGRLHGAHDIMVRPGGEPFELVTPDQHSLFGMVVQREALMAAAAKQGCHVDWAALQQAEVLHVADGARLACLQALDGLLPRHALDGVQHGPAHSEVASLQDALLSVLLGMLDTSEVDTAARQSFAKRQKVVAQAREHVLAHPDQAVTVPELCEQLHVSRRTLQYCFEDVMGLSPIQYLRAIRLNGARRHLRAAALQGQGVQDVAAHWGFWHLSQFACDYRKLFGETPSDTLRCGAH